MDDVAASNFDPPSYPKLLRKGYSTLAFNLYAKPRITKTDTLMLDGFLLHVPPTVFHPKLYHTSRYLAHHVQKMNLDGRRVLEVGCGSGFISLVAAAKGASVTAFDINEAAVTATKKNAERNALSDRITVLQSDLFEQFTQSSRLFDYIFINPPFYDGEPLHIGEHAWKGGEQNSFIRRFASSAGRFLSDSGCIIAVLSTDTDMRAVLSVFQQNMFAMDILARKRLWFETLFILRFVPIQLSPSAA